MLRKSSYENVIEQIVKMNNLEYFDFGQPNSNSSEQMFGKTFFLTRVDFFSLINVNVQFSGGNV